MESKEVRQFVAFAYSAQFSQEQGKLKPIAEYVDGDLVPVDPNTLSSSGLVFVRYGYTEIQSKYGDGQLFRVTAEPNLQPMEDMDPALWCNYICTANNIQALAPRELMEVIKTELKELSPNNRSIFIGKKTIGTSYVLLQTADGLVYGPFNFKQDSTESDMITVFPTDRPVGGPSLLSKHVFCIAKDVATRHVVTFGGRQFLKDVAAFSQADQFNFANDLEVLSFCSQLSPIGGKRLVDKSLLQSSASQLLFLKNSKNQSLTKEMFERLKEIEVVEADASKALEEGIAKFLSSASGGLIVRQYIDQNRSKYDAKIREEILSSMERELNELQTKIQKQKEIFEDYRLQSNKVSIELQRQREKVNSQEEIQKAQAELDAQIAELAARYDAEKLKYDEYRAKFQLVDELQALEISKSIFQKDVDNLRTSATEARRRIDELNAEYQQSEEKIHQRLLNLRPLVKAINGAPVGGEMAMRDVQVSTSPLVHQGATIDRQNKVIEAIGSGLAAAGRPLPKDFLVNLIVSTQQSYITFFAGLPGVGKTSLARLFAESQGLDNRFLEVAVARGWTGTKDLVGFFNPLSGRYQPSNTGVANFLFSLKAEAESGNEERNGMSYILLDEANLSPVEHYWSAFSNMADPVKQRVLSMGPSDICRIPMSLRFLATINYDGTTETLSDRILDRAPVIVMEPGIVRDRDLQEVSAQVAKLPLPFADMEDLFGRTANTAEMSPDEEEVLEKICEVLASSATGSGRPIHVSMRKMQAIRQYCNKVTGLMSEPSAALDFAVLQHVLPQVHGHGKPFEGRLRQLQDVLSRFELSRSRDYVERMVRHGAEDLHSYSFFCW